MVQNIFASREAKKHTSQQTTPIFNLQVLGKTDDFVTEIRQNKLEEEANKHITKMLELLNNLGFNTPVDGSAKEALNSLPPGSFFLGFKFKLTGPWHSKEDDPYYPIDNPLKKDLVFKVPLMGAAAWKGLFRAQAGVLDTPDGQIDRLFGVPDEKSTDSDHHPFGQGQIYFYPSFFEKIAYFNLNPHDRKYRKGKNPIMLEVVPEGTCSYFKLFYLSKPGLSSETIKSDMALIGQCIPALFYESGFGAKRSIGFGRAKLEQNDTGNQTIIRSKGAVNTKSVSDLTRLAEQLTRGFES